MYGLFLRHFYLIKSSLPRVLDLIYWPTIQIILWGFISKFFSIYSDYYNNTFSTKFTYLEFRRNIVTKNIKLNDLVGKTIQVGEIKLKVNDLCRPCKDLQQRLGKSNIIKEFLRRGGLRCEILSSGNIKIGDKITVL